MRLAAKSEYQAPGSDIPGMKAPLIKSGIFHIVLILAFTIGIPFISPPPPMTVAPPITVDLVDISEITTTPRVAKPQKPKEEPKPPEPTPKVEAPPKVSSERPPDLSKPKPPETKTAEAVPDAAPPKPLEKPPEKKPEPPKPKPEPKPEPKKEEPTKKAEPEKQQNDFQSLLKNLTPEKKEASEGDEVADKEVEPQESQIARISEKLSVSEEDALRRQLAGCWNVMAGAKFAEELIVEIRVDVNRDRTVNRASILDQGRYNRDTHFRAAADAATRALRNPKCVPLALPPDKYDQWKTTIIRFDPRDML